MRLSQLTPKQSLNKAYLKEKVTRAGIEVFKKNLVDFIQAIDEKESEEHVKNLVTKFLYDTYYHGKNQINTKGRIDLAIYEDKKPVVIIEAKRPNSPDMVSVKNLNTKAMHELILYYLRERIDKDNIDIKYMIATNMYEWFVFDASVFDKLFYKNTELTKDYNDWKNKRKASPTTDSFYSDIAFKFLKSLEEEIPFTWFDLRKVEKLAANNDPKDDSKLIDLFKILSPAHLLKQPFANDSNSLDTKFYSELLHLIGLEEKKDGGKKIIQRREKPDAGSLLENVINTLIAEDRLSELPGNGAEFGEKKEERLFNVGLELCITWINRILFLKLLEGQLLNYHAGDKRFRFLDFKTIPDYDELNKLFFQVLARKQEERTGTTRDKFQHVPYLNSSLFDISPLEADAIRINSLDNGLKLKISSGTVLKTENGKKREGELPMLQYLFEFLDAYDFSSEGKEEIQEENKALINASVLGLIFEKINGYKDGSFFTPGFITMYMCRETIRKAVVQKFREFFLTPNPLSKVERGKVTTVELGLPRELLAHAREMRKNQTNAEELLWQLLRNRKLNDWKFRRQHPIREGYILDFYCAETRVAVEVDGPIHDSASEKEYDENREGVLKEFGIRTIRFTNDEVLNDPEKVLQQIITFSTLTPNPLSTVERGPGGEVNFPDLYNLIGRTISIEQANTLINSLKICDPAVGSGHFLVSALNEIIAIKSELGILSDRHGKVLRDYAVEVINDELIISIDKHDLFEYKPSNKESQRVQEALFHEKQTIIENCLFGVDINPNSVKICRLRLWIELLKNAYYTESSKYTQLETLPNIDINIKQGNSLISRFPLDADLSKALRKSKWTIDTYKIAIHNYHHATSKEEKREVEKLIETIKANFETEIANYSDPRKKRIAKLGEQLYKLTGKGRGGTGIMLFEPEVPFGKNEESAEKRNKEIGKLEAEINKLTAEIKEIKDSAIYKDAFEWRFEFPEVLDNEGIFKGFDVVIGNPPYIFGRDWKALGMNEGLKVYYKSFYKMALYQIDLYVLFMEKAQSLSNRNGVISLIVPNTWLNNTYAGILRSFSLANSSEFILTTTPPNTFEGVNVDTVIYMSMKSEMEKTDIFTVKSITRELQTETNSVHEKIRYSDGSIPISLTTDSSVTNLLRKIIGENLSFGQVCNITRGIHPYRVGGYGLSAFSEGVQTEKDVDKRPYNSKDQRKGYRPFIYGKNLERFSEPQANEFIKYGPWLAEPRDPRFFEGERIYSRKILGDRLVVTYCNDDSVADQQVYITKPKTEEVRASFIAGILGSRLISFFIRNFYDEKEKLFPQVKVSQLKELPVPKASKKIQDELGEIVLKLLSLKSGSKETIILERKIDQLVYQLYGLTGEEIKIVEA